LHVSAHRYRGRPLAPPRTRRLPNFDGFRVFLVNGQAIRGDRRHREREIEFTMGGTAARYPGLIPDGEIWIDACLGRLDREATVRHEAREYRLMRRGMSYGRAHSLANAQERAYRRRHG
jgi:hypothetical protein